MRAWLVAAGIAVLAMPALGDDAPPSGIVIVDSRPAAELETGTLSHWISSCDYGIRRLGDEGKGPPKLALLKQDIDAALGSAVLGKTLTITRYEAFADVGAAERGSVLGGQGLVGAIVKGMGSNCTKDETTDGWYANTEAPDGYSPFVIEIAATYGDKTYTARLVYEPNFEIEGDVGDRIWSGGRYSDEVTAALIRALHKANAALIEQMRAP